MNNAKTLNDGFDLHDIDDVSIMAEHEPGRVAAKIGLICTLYVSNPHDVEVRRRLAVCGDQYLALFGSCVRLYQDPSGRGRMKTYPAQGYSLSAALADFSDPRSPFTPSFTGAQVVRDASLHSMTITAPGTKFFEPGEVVGSLMATFPIGFVLDRVNGAVSKGFRDLVLDWCTHLQPESGYAGLGFIQSVDWDERLRTIRQVSVLARRFPGLEVDNPEIVGNHVKGRIKGVNWLTVVSDRLLDSVGGRAGVRSCLDAESFPVFDYGGGLVIQAGPSPQIGDCNRLNRLDAYRSVAGLLRPLRLHFPENDALLDVGDGNETEVTNQWLARFD